MLKHLNRVWVEVASVLLVVMTIGAGTVRSYFRTAQAEFGRQVRDSVPITFELKRLEQLTTELIPEIQSNRQVAAQLDVELEFLNREIDVLTQSQADAKSEMEQLRLALRDECEQFEFASKVFTRREVEEDLTRRLERFEDTRSRLDAKQRIRDSRNQTLAAATDKIRACQHQYQLMVEKTESLQADLKLLELASVKGDFQFDHSKLQQSKDLATSLEKKIRTLQLLADDSVDSAGGIPVEADDRSVAEKFDAYFAQPEQMKTAATSGK